jgi:hypothetical protein
LYLLGRLKKRRSFSAAIVNLDQSEITSRTDSIGICRHGAGPVYTIRRSESVESGDDGQENKPLSFLCPLLESKECDWASFLNKIESSLGIRSIFGESLGTWVLFVNQPSQMTSSRIRACAALTQIDVKTRQA